MKEFIEKLIERLKKEAEEHREHWKEFVDDDSFGGMNATMRAIKIVNELAEEYESNLSESLTSWIPVTERLPETDDYVLCWYEYKVMQGTHIGEMNQTYGIGYYFNYHNSWGGEVACGVDCKVIAWQPLPAPYRSEKSEKGEWKDAFMRHFTKIE